MSVDRIAMKVGFRGDGEDAGKWDMSHGAVLAPYRSHGSFPGRLPGEHMWMAGWHVFRIPGKVVVGLLMEKGCPVYLYGQGVTNKAVWSDVTGVAYSTGHVLCGTWCDVRKEIVSDCPDDMREQTLIDSAFGFSGEEIVCAVRLSGAIRLSRPYPFSAFGHERAPIVASIIEPECCPRAVLVSTWDDGPNASAGYVQSGKPVWHDSFLAMMLGIYGIGQRQDELFYGKPPMSAHEIFSMKVVADTMVDMEEIPWTHL